MIRSLIVVSLGLAGLSMQHAAMAEDEPLVRLPGQGELRDPAERKDRKANLPDRLKPGGGLFVSFDENQDGIVSADEIAAGIPLAFTAADANADGHLTAIEQQAWAASLPTRDDSLANPVRFDPNLDRRVSISEFTSVINDLGSAYADEATGQIIVADLKAPKPERQRGEERVERLLERRQQNGERTPPGRATAR